MSWEDKVGVDWKVAHHLGSWEVWAISHPWICWVTSLLPNKVFWLCVILCPKDCPTMGSIRILSNPTREAGRMPCGINWTGQLSWSTICTWRRHSPWHYLLSTSSDRNSQCIRLSNDLKGPTPILSLSYQFLLRSVHNDCTKNCTHIMIARKIVLTQRLRENCTRIMIARKFYSANNCEENCTHIIIVRKILLT